MTERTKAPWPEANANTVFAKASEEDHQGAIDIWYKIRDELFGNADRMETLAKLWGEGKYMTYSEEAIDGARENLAGYWQGGAYDSYSAYSVNATKRIYRNEVAMNEIATVMGACIDIVYETYADALEFISSCAHDLADAAASFIEELTPWGGVAAVVKLLNDFVKNVNDLFAKAKRKMGDLREKGVFLARQANDFNDITPLADPAGNPDLWQVKPRAKDPA